MSPLNFSKSSSTIPASIPNVAIPAAFRIGPRNLTSGMKNRVQGLGSRVDGRGEGGVVMYAVSCSATLSRLSRGFSSLGGTVQLVRERSPTQPPQDRRKTGGIPLLVPKTVPFRAIYTQSASASLTPPLTTPA